MASSSYPKHKKNQPINTKVTNSLKESVAIFQALYHFKSLNRRQLSEVTQITVASLCRALYNLELKGVIKIDYKAIDPETGKSVYHYSLTERRDK